MRVDLDVLERKLIEANKADRYAVNRRLTTAQDDLVTELGEVMPAIIAELRAARECVAVLREYQWGGDTEWCDACKCHEGRHNSDCAIEGALLAYDAAVKGDG